MRVPRQLSAVSAVLIVVASAGLVAGAAGAATPGSNAAPTVKGRYFPVAPVRVVDTRTTGTPLASGGVLTLNLSGFLPSPASAAVINLTVTNTSHATFLTAYRTGTARPSTSVLNATPGQTRANSVTVPVGTGPNKGKINIWNQQGPADVVVDLLGYYGNGVAAPGPGASYYPTDRPFRLFDTRPGSVGASGTLDATLDLGGATVNRTVQAFAISLTAAAASGAGFLTAWNGDLNNVPQTSSVNFGANQTVSNLVLVPVRCATVSCTKLIFGIRNYISSSTQVYADFLGYYGAPGAPGATVYRPIGPTRVVDNRGVAAGATTTVTGISASDARAVAANVNLTTVGGRYGSGYLTAWAGVMVRPTISNQSFLDGNPTAGGTQTLLDSLQQFVVYVAAASAPAGQPTNVVQVFVDLQGVFDPDPGGPA